MDPLRTQIFLELEEPYARGTCWGTAVIGTYYLLLLPLYQGPPGDWRMTSARWITLLAGLALLAIAFTLRHPPAVPGRSESLASLGILGIAAQVFTNILIRGSWLHTSDLLILTVAMGFIVLRDRWYFGLLALVSGLWWTAAILDHHDLTLHHWAVGMVSATLVSVVIHFHLRRMRSSQERLMLDDRRLAEEKGRLATELQEALAKVKVLSGLIPICAHCKKVRDDAGYWQRVEHYLQQRSNAQFTHGICPECLVELRSEFETMPLDSPP